MRSRVVRYVSGYDVGVRTSAQSGYQVICKLGRVYCTAGYRRKAGGVFAKQAYLCEDDEIPGSLVKNALHA